ncbi:hypothetical protein GCM10009765_40770 [Fodinicola feengrottensis]|uniref:DUF5753 domain-containing protein n=1 Tax=Fodinicola feengrottensis TaxID=435914 RepID=A0ABP4TF95_9ACTN
MTVSNAYVRFWEAIDRGSRPADDLRQYESELVPGLLQTPEYAEAVIRTPGGTDEDTDVSRRVAMRQDGQRLLTRRDPVPPIYEVAISETVLHRVVGGPAVMAEQLRRINDLSDRLEHVTVRILPFSAGAHGGAMAGSSVSMRFPDADDPDSVFVEGLTGALYLRKPKELERYETAFADIFARGLDVDASRELIKHS